MSRTLRPLALALAAVAAWVCAASAVTPVPVTRTLPNGVRVAVLRDPRLPLVGVQLTVPAGSASEGLDEAGAAHMVAELVRRGTVSRDGRAYAAEVERLGGSVTTSSGRDFAAVGGLFLARDLDAAVELVADASSHAVFVDAEVEPLRSATQRAIAQQLGTPAAAAEDAAWLSAYGWTGYGRPPLGTVGGVGGLSRDALQAFYARHWRPEGAVLAIAGDVDPERAFHAAEESLGGWRGAPPTKVPAPSAAKLPRVRIIDRDDLDQAEIRVAVPGPKRGDAADVPLRVLGRVLAGSDGSRLERARAAGAPFQLPRAGFVPLRESGLFQVGVSAAPESAGAAVREVLSAIDALRASAPTEEELEPARQGIASAYSLQLETLGQVLAQWSGGALSGLPDDELVRAPARAQAVDGAAAVSAAQRWLSSDRAVIVVVGPAAAIRPQLASLGTVQVLEMQNLAAEDRPPPAPRVEFTAEQEKRGRDLMKRAIRAHGGLSKLQGVRSSILGADVTLTMERREVVGTFEQTRKESYRMLYVTKLEGVNVRQVLNGQQGWSVDPTSSTVLDADSLQLRAMRNGFDSDVPHLLLDAERSRVGAMGPSQVDGRDVEMVEVRSSSGSRRLLYLDRKTVRLAAMDQNEDPRGEGFEARRVYRDYRTVSGLVLPYEEDRLLAGQRVMRLKMTRVEINPSVDDASFLRPEEPLPPPSR